MPSLPSGHPPAWDQAPDASTPPESILGRAERAKVKTPRAPCTPRARPVPPPALRPAQGSGSRAQRAPLWCCYLPPREVPHSQQGPRQPGEGKLGLYRRKCPRQLLFSPKVGPSCSSPPTPSGHPRRCQQPPAAPALTDGGNPGGLLVDCCIFICAQGASTPWSPLQIRAQHKRSRDAGNYWGGKAAR